MNDSWLKKGVPAHLSWYWPVKVTTVLFQRAGALGWLTCKAEYLGPLNAMKNYSSCTPQQSTGRNGLQYPQSCLQLEEKGRLLTVS